MNRLAPQPLQHFYRTAALPCPYLDGRMERKVLTEIAGPTAASLYNGLSRAGFRRSHHLAYRPACAGCTACVPVRVAARQFVPSRNLRRLARLSPDLVAAEEPARASGEQYRLFSRYQRSRHAESDMASMTYGDYRAMVEDSPIETRLLTLRDPAGQLVAACLADRLDDGYSAVYSYFDPDQPRRSLGTLLVLRLVEQAVSQDLPYVYLGYWIADSRKMAYKVRFQPLESLGPTGWSVMQPPPGIVDGLLMHVDAAD
ncbi:arginine-tRNA-protein transferase [Stella humosa]|uniref:Aspartate/glutamate leucyltransferase n=1 Tax=Stella humosa TaxID=94 RepID=A0A3N1KPK2_9PROT|nr:arginyltransferase [Stella humosa]ROP81222.1 arginine-tRNA-protein transferase [Stella humosa]BBK32569.1 putative arginyl-tRNA--protein transferase [Stella humosa]